MKVYAAIAALALIAVSLATQGVQPIGSDRVNATEAAYQEMVGE